jgi:hypothetical protein
MVKPGAAYRHDARAEKNNLFLLLVRVRVMDPLKGERQVMFFVD